MSAKQARKGKRGQLVATRKYKGRAIEINFLGPDHMVYIDGAEMAGDRFYEFCPDAIRAAETFIDQQEQKSRDRQPATAK